MKTAACHPDRKHVAHGLCSSCYMRRRWDTRADVRARDAARTPEQKETRREYGRKYREANAPKLRAYLRTYHSANASRAAEYKAARLGIRREQKRDWDVRNREHCREYTRQRYAQDPLAWQAAKHKRRAGGAGVRADEWLGIVQVFGGACAYCLRDDRQLTRDHLEPVARGGLDEPDNVVPACRSCNSRKGARTLLAFVGFRL